MKLKLPNGQNVQIGIHHTSEDVKRAGKLVSQRCTKIRITKGDETITGKASCSPQDNFNKLTGRKLALLRTLDGSDFSRPEKTAIFRKICPEFYRKEKTKA